MEHGTPRDDGGVSSFFCFGVIITKRNEVELIMRVINGAECNNCCLRGAPGRGEKGTRKKVWFIATGFIQF